VFSISSARASVRTTSPGSQRHSTRNKGGSNEARLEKHHKVSVMAAILWLVPLAAAGEGTTLLNGEAAAGMGTTVACTVQARFRSMRIGKRLTARSADRRIRDPRPAPSVADGAPRRADLVGTGPAAAAAAMGRGRSTRRGAAGRRGCGVMSIDTSECFAGSAQATATRRCRSGTSRWGERQPSI
jgi:hypothetical protein